VLQVERADRVPDPDPSFIQLSARQLGHFNGLLEAPGGSRRSIEDLKDVVTAELICCMSYRRYVMAAAGCSCGVTCPIQDPFPKRRKSLDIHVFAMWFARPGTTTHLEVRGIRECQRRQLRLARRDTARFRRLRPGIP
jgi:hypothetical protein